MINNENPRRILPIGIKHVPNEVITDNEFLIEKYTGTDTEELYKATAKFCRKAEFNWRWRNEEITYTYNNCGLRMNEHIHDDYDFSETYVVLGCSFVEGVGCAEDETISAWIQKLTGVKTLNFGNGGTGCDVVFYNAMWLASRPRRPKKIFILWPSPSRFASFRLYLDETRNLVLPEDNLDLLRAFMYNNARGHLSFDNYYKMNIFADPQPQVSNKLLWKELLKAHWGDNMVELDIMDSTTPGYMDDEKSMFFYWDDLTLEEKLNQCLARDLSAVTISNYLEGDQIAAPSHWGTLVYERIAKWFISQ